MGARTCLSAGKVQGDEEEKAAAEGNTSEEKFMPIDCRGVLPISRVAETQRHNNELKGREKAIFSQVPASNNHTKYSPQNAIPSIHEASQPNTAKTSITPDTAENWACTAEQTLGTERQGSLPSLSCMLQAQ